jgi:phosphoglucomutase
VLFWLNLVAVTGQPVDMLVRELWLRHGRCVYSRHDYEGIAPERAQALMRELRAALPHLAGQTLAGQTVALADDFAYTDPVDGSVSRQQGVRVILQDGSRLVFRLSGTGTEGATLRIYLERHEPDPARHDLPVQQALAPLVMLAEQLARVRHWTGMAQPSVTT